MADNNLKVPKKGIALCLSGGGYRATLFHIGTLWRLNEFGYLPKLDRISSVSGGSIASGWLGLNWNKLHFDEAGIAQNFVDVFVNPLRTFTEKKLDIGIVLFGLLNPFSSIGKNLIKAYKKNLFGNATLQDLPDSPRFVLNASNAQSGTLFRFSKPYLADYKVGMVENPNIELAIAVAASSAFPPFLSPVFLNLKDQDFKPNSGSRLQHEPFTSKITLMDGGVYDNLGIETIYKRYDTILVSDAGGMMQPDPKPRLFWGIQAYRVLNMMDNQVRALRKKHIVDMFVVRDELSDYMQSNAGSIDNNVIQHVSRKGAYWGTFTDIRDYGLKDDALDCPLEKTQKLANLPTRLWTFSKQDQEGLINWGYAVCDAAMRRYVDLELPTNAKFPYIGGVG